MFNKSLSSGCVSEVYIAAYITPRLKKSKMYPADKSYRPISNLSVASNY